MDDLLETLYETANMLRGMMMDPTIPEHVKLAFKTKVEHIDKIVEKFEPDYE